MMTSRERVVRTLTHRAVDRAPRDLWALPAIGMERAEELSEVQAAFPSDFTGSGVPYARGRRASGRQYEIGSSMDAYGCVFSVKQRGILGEVKLPLFADDWKGLDAYQAPWETLEGLDRAAVALNCASTDKFVLHSSQVNPFERMQFLRGTEDLFCDLAAEEKKTWILRDKLHEFYLADLRFWASTPVDAVSMMDDWGTQRALLISPEKWRSFFKPLYREYCDLLHAAGKFVFFHSDGCIEAIYPDLIEIGVDAINSQLFCMDMERIGREYGGDITFWGEIDRQHILPFGSEADVRAAVRRVYHALCPNGRLTGCVAQCEWGLLDSKQNVCAVFNEWDRIAREQG